MLKMKIETPDWDRKLRQFAQTPDLIRKAVVGALSDTVDDLHTRQTMEMKRVFDRPSPYVLRGLKKRYPGNSGVMRAGTGFEFFPVGKSPEDIIKPHVFGGTRGHKRSERRLAQHGILNGGFTIQGREYPRGSGGDIAGARYAQMLAALNTMSETARSNLPKSAQRNRKNVEFFVVKRDGLPVAIAERKGGKVTVMLAFARRANYTRRYDYFGVGERQVRYSMPLHFNRIIGRYLSRMN